MSSGNLKDFLIVLYGCKVKRKNGKLSSELMHKRWEKEFLHKGEAMEFASRNTKLYKEFYNWDEVHCTVAEFIPEQKPKMQKLRYGLKKRLRPWLELHWTELRDNPVTQNSITTFGWTSKQTIGVVIALLKHFCSPLKEYLGQIDEPSKQAAGDLLYADVQEFLQQQQQQRDAAS